MPNYYEIVAQHLPCLIVTFLEVNLKKIQIQIFGNKNGSPLFSGEFIHQQISLWARMCCLHAASSLREPTAHAVLHTCSALSSTVYGMALSTEIFKGPIKPTVLENKRKPTERNYSCDTLMILSMTEDSRSFVI